MPIEELVRLGAPRPIVRWGEPVMHQPTRPVTDFGGDLQTLLADMFATNTAAHGAGLAAPQIGVDLAIFIYDCEDGDGRRRRRGVVCNPVLALPEARDRRLIDYDEGCLSLPGAYIQVARPESATCRGLDQFGNNIEITATGALGRCLQHETDHLHGRVFGERLSAKNRKILHRQHDKVAHLYAATWPVPYAR